MTDSTGRILSVVSLILCIFTAGGFFQAGVPIFGGVFVILAFISLFSFLWFVFKNW